ncbi:hypothetical protein [Peribacillus simplex]|uniref:hypothetical protein n=1 Tax=Peribacillus simplex TaxID=1478 RepID=UPI003D2A6666
MEKVHIEINEDSYKNVHLLLHNLIELTGTLSTGNDYSPEHYKKILGTINEPLRTIKMSLETK